MSPSDPDNSALDALYRRAFTRPDLRPALLEALLEHELYTLIGRGRGTRPDDEVQRPDPDRVLPLIQWEEEGRSFFFVFTSATHARAARRAFSEMAPEPLIIIGKQGRAMLESMKNAATGICFNPASSIPDLKINDHLLRDLLDGTLCSPGPEDSPLLHDGPVRPLTPEEYPLALVQPVFDHLKTRPEVMAAWIVAPDSPSPSALPIYMFALLTAAEDTAELLRSVETVLVLIESSARAGMEFGVTTLDYADPAHAAMMRTHQPFYASPDYKPAAE